jgi:outer membrane protein OmpA-like peptidoglycan-associated protein
MMVGKVVKNGSELWVEVASLGGDDYYLTVVLKELMKQDITANDMFEALNRDGRIALYINFDTGKSTIKPESKSIIEQIVQMLKANPDLKLSIEGHTDNVGNPISNKTLSEERAKSVVAAIVDQGIGIESLSPSGYGQDKPIGDNKTEEGRAKNRRVELVKK